MSESLKSKLLETDLYLLFDVEETSPIELIKKAYRRKALELHPDKNLSNKEEAEIKFVELGKAFEILADKSARAAYDAVRRQKREKAKRDQQLDDKRRKLKEDLERREAAAKEKYAQKTETLKKTKEEEWFQKEVERLRKEGTKLLEEEMNFINEQVRLDKKRAQEPEEKAKVSKKKHDIIKTIPRIKISWQGGKTEKDQLKLDQDLLEHLFAKYGEIEVLVVGKKSSAILEYKCFEGAISCLNDEENLKDKFSISLTCVGDLDPRRNEHEKNLGNLSEKNFNENNMSHISPDQPESWNSFEEMEMAILKKLKAASSK